MIGVFGPSATGGADVRLLQTYNGLSLNNPADPSDDTYEINAIASTFQVDTIDDPNPEDDGTEAYETRKVRLVVTISGVVRAPSLPRLYDKIKALIAAFDPAKGSHENPLTQGFLAYDFSVPTSDVTTFPTSLVASRYYARARAPFIPTDSEYTGYANFFQIELEMVDPRRYEQAQVTLAGAGTATNRGDYRTWPTLTLTATGAGSATYTVARAHSLGTKTLVLDLSTCQNGDVVTIDMRTALVQRTRSGVTTTVPALWASGTFFEIEPGANTITYTNTTNIAASLVYRPAYCA